MHEYNLTPEMSSLFCMCTHYGLESYTYIYLFICVKVRFELLSLEMFFWSVIFRPNSSRVQGSMYPVLNKYVLLLSVLFNFMVIRYKKIKTIIELNKKIKKPLKYLTISTWVQKYIPFDTISFLMANKTNRNYQSYNIKSFCLLPMMFILIHFRFGILVCTL